MTNPKEAFFKRALIPAAQLIELVCTPGGYDDAEVRKRRSTCMHAFYDTANLTSAFVLSPLGTVETIHMLWEDAFIPLINELFQLYGRSPSPERVLGQGPYTRIERSERINHFIKLNKLLTAFAAKAHTHIGFDSSKRNQWIHQYAPSTLAYFERGRLNRWRTFVHNTDTEILQSYFVKSGMEFQPKAAAAAFRGSSGDRLAVEARTTNLWQELFGTAQTSDDGTNDASKPSAVQLPASLTVTVVDSNKMQVTVKYTSAAVSRLGPDERKLPGYRSLENAFGFSEVCDVSALGQTIEKATRWHADHVAAEPKYRLAAQSLREAAQTVRIISKFRTVFSLSEQQLFMAAVNRGEVQVRT